MSEVIKEENLQQLRELSGGTDDLLIELVEKFITNSKQYLANAEEGYKNSDWDKIRFAVHTMKGSALSLGLTPLGEFMTELNKQAKENKFDNFESAFAEIHEMIAAIEKYYETIKK
ncbi:MAG: Hpt domain-containing protein [Spirochaetia bacterium]|nr:Hpt domain-containing protein [Spirochaetia bacterium]